MKRSRSDEACRVFHRGVGDRNPGMGLAAAQEHAQQKLSAGLQRKQARELKLAAWERRLEARLSRLAAGRSREQSL